MMHSRYLVLLLLLSCSGKSYVEVLKFSGEGYEIRVLSSDGEIKVGINEIRVEVNPPAKIDEFYLYMPAMPGMPEMREYADLKEMGKGKYEGKLKVSMEGSWQVRVKIGGRMIYKDINVPIKGGGSKEHEHGLISLYKVDSSRAPVVIYSAGRLESPRNGIFSVSPRFSGYITKVFVDRQGKFVKKGEALFEFYSPEVYSTYLEYLKGGSDLSLERLSLMGISLNDVKDSLAVFRSPVSGRILDLNVKRGERFEAGESLYEILSDNILYFVGEVPQEKANLLKVGLPVEVEGISSKIAEILPGVNPETRTVKFLAVIPAKEGLFPGMVLTAKIMDFKSGIFVPKDAVIRTGEWDIVFAKEGEGFKKKSVKILYEVDGGYIVEGLKVGEEIVHKGVFFVSADENLRGNE
jgi:RND family efflux transporter, MFP subunit